MNPWFVHVFPSRFNGKLVLAIALVWIVWGSTFLGIRVMVETIPPLLGTGFRFLLGGLTLAMLALHGSGRRAFRLTAEQWRGSAAMGMLLVAGGVGLFAIAEANHLPSSLAALIASSEAMLVLGLRVLVGRERISRAVAVSVAIGALGLVLLLLPGSRPDGIPIWAMVLGVAGAITWATGTYVGSRITTAPSLLANVSIQMLTGGTVLTAVGMIVGESVDPAAVSTASALALLGLVLASTTVYVAYGWLLRNVSLSLVTTQSYVNPVVAVALGVLVAGETFGGLAAVGMGITLLAVFLVLRAERRMHPPEGPSGRVEMPAHESVVERRATGAQPAVPPAQVV